MISVPDRSCGEKTHFGCQLVREFRTAVVGILLNIY
jgi:hypothetical protein